MRSWLLLTGGLFSSTAALAQLSAVDALTDTPITRAEVGRDSARRFTSVDLNRDGRISKEEVAADLASRTRRDVERRTARASRRAVIFSTLDSNRDGVISRAEFMAADIDPVMGRAEPRSPAFSPATFQRADTNRDGQLSLSEVTVDRLKRFDQRDGNRDGVLMPSEQRRRAP
jgi:Ca2+-binding EF-hand superfamily protein